MRAFWTIQDNNTSNTTNQPLFPADVPCTIIAPGDIYILAENPSEGINHRHTLVGGFSTPAIDGHWHGVISDGQTQRQNTMNGPDHTHLYTGRQSYFVCFVTCADEAFDQLVAVGIVPIVLAAVNGEFQVGELIDTPWSPEERTQFAVYAQALFGIPLSDFVQSGRDALMWVLGSSCARQVPNDQVLR